MRVRYLAFVLACIVALPAFAQDPLQPTQPGFLQNFTGTASQTTPAFTVSDRWELCWTGFGYLNISILAPDGSVVAGVSGPHGELYLPKGGIFHLQIDRSLMPGRLPMQNPNPVQNQNRGPTGFGSTLSSGLGGGDSAPAQTQQQQVNNPPPTYTPPAWRVDIIDMSNPAALSTSPYSYKLPDGAITAGTGGQAPSAPGAASPTPDGSTAPPSGKLTEDQARAVVLITGDNAEGTGFMIHTPDGPAIITNIHVIANNPNLKITTNSGALVTILSEKGASDRDLAMLAIKDGGYNYLDVAPDISHTVQPGDEVITPGNSQGGEVMLNTPGKVLGIGPERIEFDNPIYHGNSGGPVFHTKTGKVLGVVTEAIKVDVTNDLDKASFASRNSAISGAMRYFGLRLDTVSEWVPIDSRQFQVETSFLDQFHEQSRRLDAYLNGARDQQSGDNSDARIYKSDSKIMKANDSFISMATGGDTAQRLESLRGLLFDLQSVADNNKVPIQNLNNFYSFDRDRARDELAYRKALKDELNSIGSDIERLGNLPRTQ